MSGDSSFRIAVVVPITGMTQEKIQARFNHLMQICPPDVTLDFLQVEQGPLSIESHFEHEAAAVGMVKKSQEVAAQGYQAVIPWCTGGPGAIAAREILDIPVVQPLQASCQLAASLGYRFGLITPLAKERSLVRQVIWNLKLNNFLAGVGTPDMPVLELSQDSDRLVDALCRVSRELVDNHDADVIVLHCMGFCGLANPMMERLNVPVIDPGWAALTQAVALMRMGLRPSKKAFPYPKSIERVFA